MSVALPHLLSDSRHSLRLKLTFWMLTITVVLQAALGAAIFVVERQNVAHAAGANLRARGEAVAVALRDSADLTPRDLDSLAGNLERGGQLERAVVAVYGPDGRLITSNGGHTRREPATMPTLPPRTPVPVRGALPGLDASLGEACRYATLDVNARDGRSLTLLIAVPDSRYESLIPDYAWVLGLSLPIGAIAAAGAGWFVSGIATAPIRRFRELAGALSPEALGNAPPTLGPAPELVALQADLSETRAKLLQAFQAQDRFVSSVSHELKTPIAVLLTEAQTLRPDQLPDDARRFVLSVVEEMRRLGSMVESFLTLTKIRGGKTTLGSAQACSVNEAVMDAVEASNKMARQYNVTLVPDLADGDDILAISGSPDLLRVMIDNLVRNAIRFSPAHHSVLIRVAEENEGCVIHVRDAGPGVPGPLIDKLFDRFAQAPGEEHLGRGHGLGLSIAQGIAELHRGRITVRNLEPGGCEFSVWMPRAEKREAQAVSPRSQVRAGERPAEC